MFVKLLVRDLGIVAVALLAWHFAAPLSAGTGAASDVAGVLAGLLFGAAAFLAHEWGHCAGALASRSVVEPGTSLRSPFVFNFDSRANSVRQFLAMSFAGFAATAVVIWVVYSVLPSDLLASRVARGLVLFLASLTVILEVPLVIYSILARRVPPIDGLEPRKEPQRSAA
jgi:hypothetical protein